MWKWIYSVVYIWVLGFSIAQKPMVQLIVDPKVAQTGEDLTITVKSNVQGKIDIDLPPAFVQGNSVMSGMNQEMDYNTGKVLSYYYLSQNGTMTKEGSFTFGPAFIKKGNKVYKSNTVTVKIEKIKPQVSDDVSTRQLQKPAFGLIHKSKTKIYEGEPIVLSAKVYSHFNPSFLDGYQPYEIEGTIEKHEIGGGQQIMVEQKNVQGTQMFYFEYDKEVVFPVGTGKIAVNPFKLNLKSHFEAFPLTSNGTYVEVIPLPANPPKNFIGAVGHFSLQRSLDKKQLKQGDVCLMTVTVSGEGNLHNINQPTLNLGQGMIVYGDPVIEEDFTFGRNGASGKISYQFNLQVTKDGDVLLPPLAIAYFDPEKEQYTTLSCVAENIRVQKNAQFSIASQTAPTSEVQNDELDVLPFKRLDSQQPTTSFISTPLFFIALTSPFAFAIMLLFFAKRKESKSAEKREKLLLKDAQNDAWENIKKAEKAYSEGRDNDFYTSISQAIQLLCCVELKRDDAHLLQRKEMVDCLLLNKVPQHLVDEMLLLMKECEQARYGIVASEVASERVLESTKKWMVNFSKHFNS